MDSLLYNTEAQLNIIGLLVMGAGVSSPINFTLAEDSVVALDNEQLKSVAFACEAHKTGIHELKHAAFATIASATRVEDFLEL